MFLGGWAGTTSLEVGYRGFVRDHLEHGRQVMYEEPVYPVLLAFGAVWIVMGLFFFGFL